MCTATGNSNSGCSLNSPYYCNHVFYGSILECTEWHFRHIMILLLPTVSIAWVQLTITWPKSGGVFRKTLWNIKENKIKPWIQKSIQTMIDWVYCVGPLWLSKAFHIMAEKVRNLDPGALWSHVPVTLESTYKRLHYLSKAPQAGIQAFNISKNKL